MLAYDDMSLTSDLLLVDSAMGFFDGLEVTSFGFGLAFDFWDFIVLAEGDFVLASFDLIATTAGVSNFSLTGFDRDYAPSDYPIVFSTDSVTVNSVTVPEPSSVVMIMLAGFALANTRRKTN